ncbi:Sensor histidine kinase GacS, partial [Durusdinium trenchii]
ALPEKAPEDTVAKSQELSKLKILVVDDNLVNRIMIERFLERWKIPCKGVDSGEKALEAILDEDFDLILLDLQMPEMDGYEVAKTIRGMKSERFINIPIVAISADTLANVYHRVLSAGMDDFLAKPFNPNELFNLLYNYSQLIKHR